MSLVSNRKAHFNYEIQTKFEAGLELLGFEVKSIRSHHGSLDGAYITLRGGEAYLVNAHIPPFQEKNSPKSYDPYRERKLLLNKKELVELTKAEQTKGLTIVPISWYNKGTKIKAEIAIARGKKKFDKRDSIKKRELDRDVRRTLKNQ